MAWLSLNVSKDTALCVVIRIKPVCAGIDSLDGAPPTSPWHLRDYNPSPQVQFPQLATLASLHSAPKRSSLGQSVVACSLQPSPAAEPNLGMDYDDDDDDGCAVLSCCMLFIPQHTFPLVFVCLLALSHRCRCM